MTAKTSLSDTIYKGCEDTSELLPVTYKQILNDIFRNYRSRNISNLTGIIEDISDNYYPALTPDILNHLEGIGLLRQIPNVSQVHYERV